MKTAPSGWANIVSGGNYTYECKLNIAGVDILQSGIYEMTINGSAVSSSASVGGAIAGEINVVVNIVPKDDPDINLDGGTFIWTDGANASGGTFWSGGVNADGGTFTGIYIPKMASLIPYIRVISNGNGSKSDWLKMGEYFIDTREKDVKNGKFTAHGYDAMLKAEQTYMPSVTSGSMTTKAIVNEIATLIGVGVASETTTILNTTYSVPYYAGQYTAREMLQYIGAAYYGSFIIDDNGNLKLIRLTSTGTNTDIGGRAKSFELSEETLTYNKIVIVTSPTEEITAGSGNNILEFDCPFGTQAMANAILSALSSYEYRGYKAGTALVTPLYEIGDSVTIKDTTVQILKRTLRFNALMASDLEAPYSEEIQHEFIYKRQEERKIERLAANTASEFNIQNDKISARVLQTTYDTDINANTTGLKARMSTAESNITQNADNIALKVSQTDYNGNTIASLINQTATTVAISADKLTFDGKTVNINAGGFNVTGSGSSWSFINLTYGNYEAKMNPRGFAMSFSTWNQESLFYNSGVTLKYNNVTRGFLGFLSSGGNPSLTFYNDSGTGIATINGSGKSYTKGTLVVGSDSAYVNYALSVQGSAMASGSWNSVSLEKYKTNIRPTDFKALEVLDNTDIYSFEYKEDVKKGAHNIVYGAIIGDKYKCDKHIMTGDENGVSVYSMASILWLAVKELKKEVDELKGGK